MQWAFFYPVVQRRGQPQPAADTHRQQHVLAWEACLAYMMKDELDVLASDGAAF
jgi:hypothetical protein